MALERQNFPGRYFPLSEYHERWRKVHREMKRRGYETALVWGKTGGNFERAMEISWLSNFSSEYSGQDPDSRAWNARSFACVILEPGKEPELHGDAPTPRRDLIAVRAYYGHADVIAGVVQALKRRKMTGRMAFVGSDCLPVKYADQLRTATPEIAYVFDDDLVRRCRRVKSPRELECYREAGQIVSSALYRLCDSFYAGKTAAEAVAEASREIVRRGGTWHRIPVNFGDTGMFVQRDPTYGYSQDAPKIGDMVKFSIDGPIHQGYWLDSGRTVVAGGRPSRPQKKLLEDSYSVTKAILEAISPGVPMKRVVAAAERRKQAIEQDEDVAAAMWPINGHSNGMMWEPPFISRVTGDDEEIWEEGMVGGAESFMGRKGVGYAGWEQNFIVTAAGVELLSKTPVFWF